MKEPARDIKNYRTDLSAALEDTFQRRALDKFAVDYRASRERIYSGLNDRELIAEVAARKDESVRHLDELFVQFKEEAEKRGVQVHLARDAADANRIIAKIAEENGCKMAVKSKSMTVEEIQTNTALEAKGMEVVETDLAEWIIQLRHEGPSHMVMPAIHLSRTQVADTFTKETGKHQTEDITSLVRVARRELRRKFAEADMGISGMNFAVAESGEPIDIAEAVVTAESSRSCDCNIPNAIPGNVIAVTEEEASKLIERFGRIYNVETSVATQHIDMAASREASREAVQALAKVRADLVYSDGSGATRAVDWNKDELEAIAQDAAEGKFQPGDTRTVSGRIRQTVYPVPFAVERADPSVFAWNFNGKPMFMFIATDDTDGNCVDPNDGATHMPLRIADSIEALSDAAGGRAKEIDLLKCGDYNAEGRAMTGCFWAPELHVIDGKLSVLFMPCFDGPATNPDGTPNERAGKPDMWTGSCHIMQLKQHSDGTDFDPREPENWTVPKPILTPTGGVLNPIQRISLDMTVISDSGRWYYAWQQVGSIWIASFDPACPERLTCEPKQVVVPEFAWDNMIAEGPNAIVHDGTIYLIYSGSLVGIDYTTGLVTAPAGQNADLTDPNVWTKLDYPLQKSGVYNGQWQLGTGHGMWSNDEDGNLIYVFHNAEYENGRYGGRDAQVRRVHWSKEGMPILDMQAAEELNPDYADITMKIVVSGNKG